MRLDIYQDSRGSGQCRTCGAPIEWAEIVKSGKRMPFEGTIRPVESQASLFDGRVLETVDTLITPTHWERCPDAREWKRK